MSAQLADHTSKAAVSPRCEVIDLILPWFAVYEGDLVLCGGQLCQLERMWPSDPGTSYVGVRLLHGGRTIDHYVDSNAYTAVRRYVSVVASESETSTDENGGLSDA